MRTYLTGPVTVLFLYQRTRPFHTGRNGSGEEEEALDLVLLLSLLLGNVVILLFWCDLHFLSEFHSFRMLFRAGEMCCFSRYVRGQILFPAV